MYTKQESSKKRQEFWTRFGQYMRPVRSSTGETVNWVNYKTGIRYIYFRMDADTSYAAIAIELHHPDAVQRLGQFEKFRQLRQLLEEYASGTWEWSGHSTDESGRVISRIRKKLDGVNVMSEQDWPAIISFLKPGIVALDQFWNEVKEGFE